MDFGFDDFDAPAKGKKKALKKSTVVGAAAAAAAVPAASAGAGEGAAGATASRVVDAAKVAERRAQRLAAAQAGQGASVAAVPRLELASAKTDAIASAATNSVGGVTDSAFAFDETFDDDIAARKDQPRLLGAGAAALFGGGAKDGDAGGSKFGASIAAAREQRALDRDDAIVEQRKAERRLEEGDADIAQKDSEIGTFMTAGFRARLAARREAQLAGGDGVADALPLPNVTRAHAADAVDGGAAEDDYFAAVMGGTDESTPAAPAPTSAPVDSKTSASTAPAEPTTSSRARATADGAPTGEGGAGFNVATTDPAPALAPERSYEQVMQRLEEARRERRRARAAKRLSDAELQAAVNLYRQRQLEAEAALAS